MVTYTGRRGETLSFVISTPLGTDLTGWDATCQMRPHKARKRVIDPDEELSAELAVSSFAGDDDYGPGWYFTLTEEVSLDLALGTYILDARIVPPGGEAEYSDYWLLRLIEPVTGVPA